jgi:hypothetical protein
VERGRIDEHVAELTEALRVRDAQVTEYKARVGQLGKAAPYNPPF